MGSTTAVDPQAGMFDRELSDSALEKALEDRESLKQERAEANRVFTAADKRVKDQLAEFDLAVGEVARVGRFKIKKTATPPREVSFSAEGGERLSIKAEEV